jgi:hypothetical protein
MAGFLSNTGFKGFLGMPKTPPKKPAKTTAKVAQFANLDLDPEAWPKFEKLVKSAARLGPKPHKTKGVR